MHPELSTKSLSPVAAISVPRSVLAGCFGTVWIVIVFGYPLPMLLESMETPGVWIGLLMAVLPLTLFAQVPGSVISDALANHKKYGLILTVLCRLLWLFPILFIPVYAEALTLLPLLIIGIATLSGFLMNGSHSAYFCWLEKISSYSESARSRRIQSITITACGIGTMIFSGLILDWFVPVYDLRKSISGFVWLLGIAVVFGLLGVYLHLPVQEPRKIRNAHRGFHWKESIAVFRLATFRQLTWVMSAWYFAQGILPVFSLIYLRKTFRVSYLDLAIVLGITVAGIAGGHPLVRRLSRRWNVGTLFSWAISVNACINIIWFFVLPEERTWRLFAITLPQPVLLAMLAGFFNGISLSGILFCQKQFFIKIVPTEMRKTAWTWHGALIGLIAALAPVISGIMMDWFIANPIRYVLPTGTRIGFFQPLVVLHFIVLSVWLLPLMIRYRLRAKTDSEVMPPLPQAWVNPIAPYSDFPELFSEKTIERKETTDTAEFARENPFTREPIQMLRERLSVTMDPTAELIIDALHHTENEEAVWILIEYVNRTHALYKQAAIRALGAMKNDKARPVLLELLEEQDITLARESILALGHLGGEHVSDRLLKIFNENPNKTLQDAAISALGMLRYSEALPSFFEILEVTSDTHLKTSLSIAIADIIGDQGEFIHLLTENARARASEIERIAFQFLKIIRRLLAEHPSEKSTIVLMEQLERAFEEKQWLQCAKVLEQLFSILWEGLESRGLSTGKMYLVGPYLRTLSKKTDKKQLTTQEILLGIYLFFRSCPIHPLATLRKK